MDTTASLVGTLVLAVVAAGVGIALVATLIGVLASVPWWVVAAGLIVNALVLKVWEERSRRRRS